MEKTNETAVVIGMKSTNEELKAILGDALKSGNLVVTDIVPTKNSEYTMIYCAQNVGDLPSVTSDVAVSEFEKKQLGWDSFLMRSRFNALSEVADNLEIGTQITGVKIRVFDSLNQAYEEQSPRLDREGNERATADGEPIYRNTHVVFTKEFKALGGHEVIPYVVPEEGTVDIEEIVEPQPKQKVATKAKIKA